MSQKTAFGHNNLYDRSNTVTRNRSKVKVTDSSAFWSLSFVESGAKPMDTVHKIEVCEIRVRKIGHVPASATA